MMIRTVRRAFSRMYPPAYLALRLCLSLCLAASCGLLLYINVSDEWTRLLFSHCLFDAVRCILSSGLFAFCGAFLLDLADKDRQKH